MTKAQQIHTVDWRAEAWLTGTSMLGPNEGWLYATIINLIYAHGDGIKPDLKWIGRVANMHGRAVKIALARLTELGKVWETDGKLMAKRCENELENARKRVSKWIENGGELGRPPKKNKGLPEAPHTDPLAHTRGTTNHQPPTTTVSGEGPETDVRAEESDAEGGGKQAEVEFEAWWQRYPNKVGKGAARTKFAIARRKASQQTLLDGVDGYIASKPPDRSWCNPQTWLNQERWLDQPAAPDEIPAEGPLIEGVWQSLDDKWTTAVKHWRGGKRWVESLWGPAPGDPGCQIPSKYLIEEVA